MMGRAFTFVSFAVMVALSTRLLASAEDASPQLQVRTAEGQALYHVGERIPLELSFTGPENKRFEINMASYDRSGRMGYEECINRQWQPIRSTEPEPHFKPYSASRHSCNKSVG
jgi:hypothetical protein